MWTELGALPFVDVHDVTVAAPADAVWRELGRQLRWRPEFAVRLAVGLLGTDSRRAIGDPLTVGATLPGFTVTEALPARWLVLSGRHHFSDYALVFELTGLDGSTVLAARTLARFPGLPGRVYRALVIGSRGHRVLVRRWLRSIRRAAEAAARG